MKFVVCVGVEFFLFCFFFKVYIWGMFYLFLSYIEYLNLCYLMWYSLMFFFLCIDVINCKNVIFSDLLSEIFFFWKYYFVVIIYEVWCLLELIYFLCCYNYLWYWNLFFWMGIYCRLLINVKRRLEVLVVKCCIWDW